MPLRFWSCRRCGGTLDYSSLYKEWACLACGCRHEDGYVAIAAVAKELELNESQVRGAMRLLGIPERYDGIAEYQVPLLRNPRLDRSARRTMKVRG